MSESTTAVPPGWYPDQSGQQRWWDGTRWTENVQAPYDPAAQALALKAPDGTKTGTAWIWLIVLLPLLSIGSLFLIDIGGYMQSIVANPGSPTSTLGIYTSPGYLLAMGLGFVIYGLQVFFASRDVHELTQRGVQRPFHWAFAFLGGMIYAIGRSVVVKRRTGGGLAPLWGAIAVYLVSVFASLVWVVMSVMMLAPSPVI